MAQSRRRFESIDECLGPAEQRFFGSGYRRVTRRIHDLSVHNGAQARATLDYPADWSLKDEDTELRPHLSSVDAMVLGLALAEAYLIHAHGLDGPQRRRMWPRLVGLKAGTAPQEELTGFDIEVARTAEVGAGAVCANVSALRARLGTMKVACDIEHDGAAEERAPSFYAAAGDLLGPTEDECVGAGYHDRRHVMTNVDIDTEEGRFAADVVVEPGDAEGAGMGAAYQPSLTMVDGLLVMAQLAQALLYEIDVVDRNRTNTMWLRNLRMEVEEPHQPLSVPCRAWAELSDNKLLSLRGRSWRKVDVTGHLAGISVSGSIAHELPLARTR
ncbi:AvrD family protein [Actinophytocola sp.]|uniref:AvrD family protein n=1 Tax=Actinophytocola sp. TaxID=1872138 RepID=UPI002ED426AA